MEDFLKKNEFQRRNPRTLDIRALASVARYFEMCIDGHPSSKVEGEKEFLGVVAAASRFGEANGSERHFRALKREICAGRIPPNLNSSERFSGAAPAVPSIVGLEVM